MPILANQNKDMLDGEQYYEGQETMLPELTARLTGFNQDTIIIPFGRGVIRTTGNQAVALPSAAGQKLFGVTRMTNWQWQRNAMADDPNYAYKPNIDADGLYGYAVGMSMGVVVRGVIAVKWANAFTFADDIYCIHTPTPATIERRGMFRAGAAANAFAVPGGACYESGAVGAVSPLMLGILGAQ